jgi:hypothetical protein
MCAEKGLETPRPLSHVSQRSRGPDDATKHHQEESYQGQDADFHRKSQPLEWGRLSAGTIVRGRGHVWGNEACESGVGQVKGDAVRQVWDCSMPSL